MTIDVDAVHATLPAHIKAGGVDNAAIVKIPEDSEDSLLTNSDVFPEPGMSALISLFLADDNETRVTLRGPLTDAKLIPLADAAVGNDFTYGFVAQQHKLFDDEPEFSGYWAGSLQYSKFRWVVRDLSESTKEAFESAQAQEAAIQAQVTKESGEDLYTRAMAAVKAGNNEEALVLFTKALVTCEIDEEDAENDEDLDPNSVLRLQILVGRAQAATNLKAYRTVVRDGELVERIYGRPVEALNQLQPAEATHYFQSIFLSAEAHLALGNKMHAGSGFMAIMLLQMIKDQAEDVADDAAGDVPLPVPTDLADHLIDAASAHLDKLEAEPHLTSIYRLKITLEGVEPTVWRTLEVKSTTTLGELREYIMMAFGWCGAPNTHEFAVYDHGLVRFTTIPDDFVIPDEEDQEIDERHEICEDEDCTEVGMVVSAANDTFTFTYEKGDWVHHISVESVREEVIEEEDGCCSHDHSDESAEPHEHKKPTLAYPKLVDGAHACPPDEVGGPAGYKSFLSAISTNAPAGPFTDRISALTFAADHVGFSNSALDSWPGATKRSLEDLLSTEEPSKITEVTEDESTKDLTAGGWKPDAFDLTEVGKALDAIANMMAEGGDDEDDWESDEEEEAEESGDDVE